MSEELNKGLKGNISPERALEFNSAKLERIYGALASMLTRVVRAVQEKYGEEGYEVCHQAIRGPQRPPGIPPKGSLQDFCNGLEKGCFFTHEWERVIDEPNRRKYIFTKCLWAAKFREVGGEDIGFWICEGDEPSVRAYNANMKFTRTKTLMEGDEVCDHMYEEEIPDC